MFVCSSYDGLLQDHWMGGRKANDRPRCCRQYGSGFWPCMNNHQLDVLHNGNQVILNLNPPTTTPPRSFRPVSTPSMHDVFLFPAASSAVDAHPFKGLCMGDLRVVSPRNFSDFPGHSQLLLIRYADDKEPHPCFGGPRPNGQEIAKESWHNTSWNPKGKGTQNSKKAGMTPAPRYHQ